jgi:hypothetical protein
MKRVFGICVLLCGALLTTPCPLFAENLLVENFDARGGPNRLGGISDIWTQGGGAVSALYAKNDRQSPTFDRQINGYALRLKYNVDGDRKESGWWTGLKNADYARFGSLTFWVRGDLGGEHCVVGIKDSGWFETKVSLARYLPGGVKKEWARVRIPLHDFSDVRNWTALDNMSITFAFEQGAPFAGSIYIDNIEFTTEGEAIQMRLPPPTAVPALEKPDLAKMDNYQFLDLVEKRAFMYFWNEANPKNGLIKDLSNAFNEDNYPVASIASVGFGLGAICVADQRGWIPRQQAYDRILSTLRFFKNDVYHNHGFFYHYLDMKTGERKNDSELSSIDTALFLAGALFAGQYFEGTEIEKLAGEIYDRVDWKWLLNDEGFISMGWKPESGFIPHSWNSYNEMMILYLLAIGSSTHPITPNVWSRWARPRITFEKYSFVGIPPLFAHQYSHIWVNFRNKRDSFTDYFENSVIATTANRAWCVMESASFKGFGPDCWGLTASDGPKGYGIYGAPHGYCDGTIAPTAAISSIVFTPKNSIKAMKHMYEVYGERIWGKYGFTDAFNPSLGWYSEKNIGIDQGPIVLMIENYRTGMVWKYFMRIPNIQRALALCGFKKSRSITNPNSPFEYRKGRHINSKTVCPFCKKKLWEAGRKKKKRYVRCPRCLKVFE